MYLQANGSKRKIVIDSKYMKAVMEYDCESGNVVVAESNCDPDAITKPEEDKIAKRKNANKETSKAADKIARMYDRSVTDVIKGVAGIAKSEMGIGKVSQDELDNRWAACHSCEHNQYGFCAAKKKATGKACGCRICDMVRIGKNECPLPEPEKKWGKFKPSRQ